MAKKEKSPPKKSTGKKSNEEKILERLDRIEAKLTPIADSAASVGELKEELTPRVNEAVQALIIELADVEADFQLEKLIHLIKKLMRNIDNFSTALDLLHMLIDFSVNAEPLMKVSVPRVIGFLDELEQKNVFKMLNIGLDVVKGITERYTPEEIEQIAGGFGKITDALGNLADPKAVALLEKASKIPAAVNLDEAEATGPVALIKAMNDPEIRQGLGIVLELTRGLAAVQKEA